LNIGKKTKRKGGGPGNPEGCGNNRKRGTIVRPASGRRRERMEEKKCGKEKKFVREMDGKKAT